MKNVSFGTTIKHISIIYLVMQVRIRSRLQFVPMIYVYEQMSEILLVIARMSTHDCRVHR